MRSFMFFDPTAVAGSSRTRIVPGIGVAMRARTSSSCSRIRARSLRLGSRAACNGWSVVPAAGSAIGYSP